MKSSVSLLIALAIFSTLQAQEFSKLVLPLNQNQKVILEMKYANMVQVASWDKNEVLVQAEVNINDGKLNHAHKIEHAVDKYTVTIIADLDKKVLSSDHADDCDESGASYYKFDDNNESEQHRLCSDIKYIVFVPAITDLQLVTTYGDVTIINMLNAIDARSVTGTVEVTISGNQPADVYLKSVMGNVSSYPELPSLNENMKPLLSRELKAQLNGGGKSVHLESVIGNVSLRSLNN
jgi:hypothetical protein